MDNREIADLCRQVAEIALKIEDEGSLLYFVHRILKPSEMVLITSAIKGVDSIIVNVTPGLAQKLEPGVAAPNVLIEWYADKPRTDKIHGYHPDTLQVVMFKENYSAVGVGFGAEHDLIFLYRDKPAKKRTSYHLWAISFLVRAFECNTAFLSKKKNAKTLQTIPSQYNKNLILESGGYSILTQKICALMQKKDFLETCKLLSDNCFSEWHGGDVMKVTSTVDAEKTIAIISHSSPEKKMKEWETLSMWVLHKGWQKIKEKSSINNTDLNGNSYFQPTTIWHQFGGTRAGWRFCTVNKKRRFKISAPDLYLLAKEVKCLMSLSIRLFVICLRHGWPDKNTSKNSDNKTLVGRNALLGYFGILIAQSDKFSRDYLSQNQDYSIPLEPRRDFLLQLSNFYLGLTQRLQIPLGLEEKIQIVEPDHFLEGLLFLIDRYAHLQLGVDEWIDIRHHIDRAFRSEIDRHLASSYYRDHLRHVIDVFLLGHLLLRSRVAWSKSPKNDSGELKMLVNQLTYYAKIEDNDPKDIELRQMDEEMAMRNWAVAALLHDVGYQLDLNQTKEEDSTKTQEAFLEEYFDLGSVAPGSRISTFQDFVDEKRPSQILEFYKDVILSTKKDLEFSRDSPEMWDHGVFSALRLYQILKAVADQSSASSEDSADFITDYRPALHAIYHHNLFNQTVSTRTHPLSCLLRLCDELQEWGRERIDIEDFPKKIYLALEGETKIDFEGRRILAQMEANIQPSFKCSKDSEKLELELMPINGNSHFFFTLMYLDPEEAQFDVTMTLLSKTYNWQHLNFDQKDTPEENKPRCSITLSFPRPDDYDDLTEYDIYTQFAKEGARWLPPFLHGIEEVSPQQQRGLLRINNGDSKDDKFAIVLCGSGNREISDGWLRCDPGSLREPLREFKEKYKKKRKS